MSNIQIQKSMATQTSLQSRWKREIHNQIKSADTDLPSLLRLPYMSGISLSTATTTMLDQTLRTAKGATPESTASCRWMRVSIQALHDTTASTRTMIFHRSRRLTAAAKSPHLDLQVTQLSPRRSRISRLTALCTIRSIHLLALESTCWMRRSSRSKPSSGMHLILS